MMTPRLTNRQQQIYDFLCEYYSTNDGYLTMEQLCRETGMKSRGSMHKHIQALVDAGLVEAAGRKQRGIRLLPRSDSSDLQLPLIGKIAAGRPILAAENPEIIDIPKHLAGQGNCYVLQIEGDSMIEDGILDGDWVIIEHRSHARDGEIVVALIDGEDATLKHIEQTPGEVILHPANAAMQPMRYRTEQVQIRGVLVGQMRSYK